MAGNKSISELSQIANVLRKDVIKMLTSAGSGHTGGSLGMADIFAALYFKFLKTNPKQPTNPNRDYVFLSNGHICPILYASLANRGFFKKEELTNLRKINSLLQGHPHNTTIPGVENSSGPLGQGLSMAVGAAISLDSEKKSNKVVTLTGDGELNEGQCWEAFMLAAKYRPKNLIIIVDQNKIQLDGNTEDVMPLDLKHQIESFGLDTIEINGNSMSGIDKALSKAFAQNGPLVIIANTIPGKGVSFMEGDFHWHGKAPTKEEETRALEELS